jgi:hypothetical protein
MTVRCEGDSRIMEQLGEKQDFEAELSRLGLRHEDFALHVRRSGLGGIDRGWDAHYAVRVCDVVTGTRGIYWGGPGEDWVAQFATDVAEGRYRGPPIRGKLPVPVRKSLRDDGVNLA